MRYGSDRMILQDRENGEYYATKGMYCVTLNIWVTLEMEIPDGQNVEEWVTDDFKHCKDAWVNDIRGDTLLKDEGEITQVVEVDIVGKVKVNTPDPFYNGDNNIIDETAKDWAEDIADHGKMISWEFEYDEIEEIRDWDDEDR